MRSSGGFQPNGLSAAHPFAASCLWQAVCGCRTWWGLIAPHVCARRMPVFPRPRRAFICTTYFSPLLPPVALPSINSSTLYFINSFRSPSQVFSTNSDPTGLGKSLLVAPNIADFAWTPEQVWDAGLVDTYDAIWRGWRLRSAWFCAPHPASFPPSLTPTQNPGRRSCLWHDHERPEGRRRSAPAALPRPSSECGDGGRGTVTSCSIPASFSSLYSPSASSSFSTIPLPPCTFPPSTKIPRR
ncbi:hypothetical protein B0H16DRAFT_1901617 [Mycena metata]|uniref:Uncharacterized protein n=1 Tax=Mycena metata TaxID=1033252 RepID=A0AAD7GWF8_9AGAR|nr:hypothetical protein B0H16DRAFT_1901617 [Mycena metata]